MTTGNGEAEAVVAAAFVAAVARLGGDPDRAAASAADLVVRYREPERHYHGLAHARAVLAHLDELATDLRLDDAQRARLALAACAHDVIYEGVPGSDEDASATWAQQALDAAGVRAAESARVGELVRFTADHLAPPGDAEAAALLDADLAILGASEAGYDHYAAAVRLEYGSVADGDWRRGRAAVLERLLRRDPLYRTVLARRRWEAAARGNLRRELSRLRG